MSIKAKDTKAPERLVRDSDAVGFTEALAEVERIATELSQALTCVIQPAQGKEA